MKEFIIKQNMHKGKTIIPAWIPFAMIFLKIMYVISIDLFLPEMTNLWAFNKSVDLPLVILEMPVFLVVLYVYMGTLKTGSLYGCISTMLFIMYFIPNNSGLSLSSYELLYYFLVNSFCLALFSVLGLMVRKEEKFSDAHIDFTKLWKNKKMVLKMRIILVFVCAIIIAYVYAYNGLNFSYLTSSMYETRAEYASFAYDIQGSLLSYIILIITMAGGWMLLVCLYFSIMAKKILDIILCLFTYLALFTVEMQKGTLAVIAIVIFVAWQEKRGKLDKISFSIIKAFVALFLVIFSEYLLFKTSYLFTLIAKRMFYTPSYLTHTYYEFFSTTSKIWFTSDAFLISNILSSLIGRIHPSHMIKLISQNAFSGLLPSPNTGLFAEAYAQMGVLGIVIYPFIFGKAIKIMGESSKWYGNGVAFVIMCRLSLTLLNTQILTSRNVVGIAVFYIISYLVIKRKRMKILENSIH
jgi:hypothetical protein